MTVPLEVRGVWRRSELSLGEDEPFEYQDAFWFQDADAFVDVRLDRDGPGASAFAGVSRVDDDTLVWEHHLDIGWAGGDDSASFHVDGHELVERGTVDLGDGPLAYTERWQRLESWTTAASIWTAGAAGRAGHLLAIGDFVASVVDDPDVVRGGWILRRKGAAWERVIATNPAAPAPSLSSTLDRVEGPSPLVWQRSPAA